MWKSCFVVWTLRCDGGLLVDFHRFVTNVWVSAEICTPIVMMRAWFASLRRTAHQNPSIQMYAKFDRKLWYFFWLQSLKMSQICASGIICCWGGQNSVWKVSAVCLLSHAFDHNSQVEQWHLWDIGPRKKQSYHASFWHILIIALINGGNYVCMSILGV